jgi:large subunit ribosomal protein L5
MKKMENKAKSNENPMRNVRVEKVTLNIGAGKDQNLLTKGVKLLKSITGIDPIKTVTQKRIPQWDLRPGLPIGCKITLRKQPAIELIKRLLTAREHKLTDSNFDQYGNVSFGLTEYIDIPGVKYDPEIGMMGLQVCVTLERPGYRIKRRKIKAKIHKRHLLKKEDAMRFFIEEFKVKVGEEQ